MRYEIKGDNLPVVICYLENGEKMITESGGMSWMTANMRMETGSNGGLSKMFGRMFSGESMFQNTYTAEGSGMIAFASCFPGSIVPFEITPSNPIIMQKSAFLASEAGVKTSVYYQKKFSTGFFGGEGFILQKVEGNGLLFAEFDGAMIPYELAAGEQLVVDTGYLGAMSATCTMDVKQVSGVKNALFGGEGLFNTVITGPGKVYLQTIPINKVADAISPYLPTSSSSN